MKCRWCGCSLDLVPDEEILLNKGVCSQCLDDERTRIAELAADFEDDRDGYEEMDGPDDCTCGKSRDETETERHDRCDSCGGVVA